jgi:hypothetical protein
LDVRVRGRKLNPVNAVKHGAIENVRSSTPNTDHPDFPGFVGGLFPTVLAIQLDHIGAF